MVVILTNDTIRRPPGIRSFN